MDICAKAPLGTGAAAARTTIDDLSLARCNSMMDERKKDGETKPLNYGTLLAVRCDAGNCPPELSRVKLD